MKAAIKREQNQACLGFAEREQARCETSRIESLIYEEGDLEDDFAVYRQYSDGCTDGIWHDIVFRTRSTGAALGTRW